MRDSPKNTDIPRPRNVSDKYFVRMINKPEVGQIASDRYSANIQISE